LTIVAFGRNVTGMVRAPLGGAGRALLALAWIAFAGAASGCQLLLDFSELADGGPSDDGAPPGDASPLCENDEPHDSFDMAAAVTTGALGAVCGGGDLDFYKFTVDGNQDVTMVVNFTAGESTDLELSLVDSAGTVLTVSTGLDGDERIEQSAALGNRLAAGDYAAEIYGRTPAVSNEYEFILTITTP
jgi:hypothetical protein